MSARSHKQKIVTPERKNIYTYNWFTETLTNERLLQPSYKSTPVYTRAHTTVLAHSKRRHLCNQYVLHLCSEVAN